MVKTNTWPWFGQLQQQLLDVLKDAVAVFTIEGKLYYANRAFKKMCISLSGSIEGMFLDNVVNHLPVNQEQVVAIFNAIVDNKEFIGKQNIQWSEQGVELHAEMTMRYVEDEQEPYILVTIHDNTDLKKSELMWKRKCEQLHERENELAGQKDSSEMMNDAKSRFLSNMSHEIRTPVNGVLGMIQMLLDTNLTEEQQEYATMVYKSGNYLSMLINDILDFSKMETKQLNIENINFDLRIALSEVMKLLALRVEEKGLEFHWIIESDLPSRLCGDPGRIKQVITNLVINAIKYTEQGKITVSVSAETEDDQSVVVCFSVVDTGSGIANDKFETIFQPFSHAETSPSDRYQGTGLGLAICKQLVELMGGTLGVESKVGVGSNFWFSLRLQKQLVSLQPEMIEVEDIKNIRILVVDNKNISLKVLTLLLRKMNFSFEVATHATVALEKLRSAVNRNEPFSVVLIDMFLPGIDGEQLGCMIKSDPLFKTTGLVMLTSIGERGDHARIEKKGFSAYLTKPVSQRQLFQCIVTIYSRMKATDSLSEKYQCLTSYSLAESQKNKNRILIVEDNTINREVISKLVEKLGYFTDVVFNGIEAIDALQKNSYSLVLMDLQMPQMNGIEATITIRKSDSGIKNPNVPIIAVTANALEGVKKQCLEAGMDDYLTKPIKIEELSQMLDHWIHIAN